MLGQRQRSNEIYFRKIDFIFCNEEKIRVAVAEARADDGRPHLRQKAAGSDPTATQAVRNLTPLLKVMINCNETIEFPERWLEVIDKTWAWAQKQKDCRYEAARRRYAKDDYHKTCRELHISTTTFFRLVDLVKMYAALHAVQLGLIRV